MLFRSTGEDSSWPDDEGPLVEYPDAAEWNNGEIGLVATFNKNSKAIQDFFREFGEIIKIEGRILYCLDFSEY